MSKATTEAVAAPAPATPPRAAELVDLPAEIERSLAFHGTPVAAQVLRDVLGTIGRAATEASRRMPKNRPEELRGKGWEKASLLALAELCTALAPEVGTINAPRDPDLFPTGVSPETLPAGPTSIETEPTAAEVDAQAAMVTEIERGIMSDGDVATMAAEVDRLAAPTETQVREEEVAAELAAIEAAQSAPATLPSMTVHGPDAWIAPVEETAPGIPGVYGPDAWIAAADEEATPGK